MTDPTRAMPTPDPQGSGAGSGAGGAGVVLGNRYRLEAVAGRGGMAEVWRARDTVLDRIVAVKWFTPGAGDVAAPARQQAEMKLLAGFNHPGLVTVYDAGVQHTPMGERPYVVMEFVDGPTLAARLTQGPLPPAAVAAIGSTLADALAYVHARGVVHRDVKPGNVLLEGGDEAGPTTVKLADFGIARLVDDARVTKTGMTVGTASYLSPEQVRGETITPASDVYSLALVLLEAFTGKVEFPGSPVEAAVARLNRDPVIPGRLGPMWGPLLAAMTARDPGLRPTTREVADRLSGTPGATGPASATTSYIPPANVTAYTPRPAVVSTGGIARPPVRPMPPVRAPDQTEPPDNRRPPRPIWPWVALVVLLAAAAAIIFFLVDSGSGGTARNTTSTSPTPSTSASISTAASTPTPTPSASTSSEPTTPPPASTVTVTESQPSTPETTPSTASTTPSTSAAATSPPPAAGQGKPTPTSSASPTANRR